MAVPARAAATARAAVLTDTDRAAVGFATGAALGVEAGLALTLSLAATLVVRTPVLLALGIAGRPCAAFEAALAALGTALPARLPAGAGFAGAWRVVRAFAVGLRRVADLAVLLAGLRVRDAAIAAFLIICVAHPAWKPSYANGVYQSRPRFPAASLVYRTGPRRCRVYPSNGRPFILRCTPANAFYAAPGSDALIIAPHPPLTAWQVSAQHMFELGLAGARVYRGAASSRSPGTRQADTALRYSGHSSVTLQMPVMRACLARRALSLREAAPIIA